MSKPIFFPQSYKEEIYKEIIDTDKIKCKFCGITFIRKNSNQKFCCRKCFKKYDYRIKKRNPSFICPNCNLKSELKFIPVTSPEKWKLFKCECGYSPYYGKKLI